MFKKVLSIGIATATLTGCTPSEFVPPMALSSVSEVDAVMSTMTIDAPNIADGISVTNITLNLRDKKGQGMPGLTMTLTVSGSNNTIIPCTVSNASGRSECQIMTTTSEMKHIQVVGMPGMTASVWFSKPSPTMTLFSLVSAGAQQTAPSGHKFLVTTGNFLTPPILKDASGVPRTGTTHLSTMIDLEGL